MSQSINQSIKPSIINQLINQSISNQSMKQWSINHQTFKMYSNVDLFRVRVYLLILNEEVVYFVYVHTIGIHSF
jgi:hypothetical protein